MVMQVPGQARRKLILKEESREKIMVKVKLGEGASLPEYKSERASGFDISSDMPAVILSGDVRVLSTGLFF